MQTTDWLNRPIELAQSAGGVYAFRSPWDGVVRGDVAPWPPPELVQKLYQSRQTRAYREEALAAVTAAHGYYADLQSVHSEDAVTWSLFGPIAYAGSNVRDRYVAEVCSSILGREETVRHSHVWLWRRIPHPDKLVPGGPEIDFGLQTERILVLGEAKWRSQVGAGQGADGMKDQIELRVDFCKTYGRALFPGVERFVVLFVSPRLGALTETQRALGSERVTVAEATWEQLGGLASNPWRDEFVAHLAWRQRHSQMV